MYIITDWIKTKTSGKRPNLPKRSGFILLFDQGVNSNFGLFECEYIEKEKMLSGMEKVSDELDGLIDTAKQFPPILAIARSKINKKVNTGLSRVQFTDTLLKTISKTLKTYKPHNFLFEKASKTEIGYIYKGDYYWIVAYNESENLVYWVSNDFFIYQNPIDYFKQSKELIKKHFVK